MIAIVDYGVGNLFSLTSSFRAVGADTVVTNDREVIARADKLILPGVGAFADASRKLFESGMADAIYEETAKGKPIMGICLGMQLLFEESLEHGRYKGLGLLPGIVSPIADVIPDDYKIPHIGWNALTVTRKDCELFRDTKDGDCVYFVHSYYADTEQSIIAAVTEYGAPITASVHRGNVYGCQFHPEKSGNVGLSILKAYCGIGGEK